MIALAEAREGGSRTAIGIRSPLRTDLAEYADTRGTTEICRHIPIADAFEALAAELDGDPGLIVSSATLEWDDFRFSPGHGGYRLERRGELMSVDPDLADACRAAAASIRGIPAPPRLALAG